MRCNEAERKLKMTEKRKLTCIICPLGCTLDVAVGNSRIEYVRGNKCKRGISYAQAECINPTRTLTTTMTVEEGKYPLISVKSEKERPRHLIPECMEVIKQSKAKAPIYIGDIVVENILYTGVNIVATNNIEPCIADQ